MSSKQFWGAVDRALMTALKVTAFLAPTIILVAWMPK